MDVWCLFKADKQKPFKVKVLIDSDVTDLKYAIYIWNMMKLSPETQPDDLVLWKLNVLEPLAGAENLSLFRRIKLRGDDLSIFATNLDLDPAKSVSGIPLSYHPRCLDVIVQLPDGATISPNSFQGSTSLVANDASRKCSDLRIDDIGHSSLQRKWSDVAPIHAAQMHTFYFLDPAEQTITTDCLNAILDHQFVLLMGPPASGKTTRLLRLKGLLERRGYRALYFSFERVSFKNLWRSLGNEMQLAHKSLDISSRNDFFEAFARRHRRDSVVLLIDELSMLYSASDAIRDDFLHVLREIKCNSNAYAIDGIIAAGTSSILRLTSLSPINFFIQNPYFAIGETRNLFRMFMQDNLITIEDAVIQDIWAKSNGHPAMVCVCGHIISNRFNSLVDPDSRTLPYSNWQNIPIEVLYSKISHHRIFSSMIDSLCHPDAESAISFFRSHFAGFLDVVTVSHLDTKLAEFLTSQGVLLQPDLANALYHIASPLMDGLIRTRVIPIQFPIAPSLFSPISSGDAAHRILDTLIEAVKFFDKDLIRSACTCSCGDSCGQTVVPREGIYDTELMRVLFWLARRHNWMVTGQWHLGTHRHTEIILQIGEHRKVVLGVLATENQSAVKLRIEQTLECMDLVAADEGWVINFTPEDKSPMWQSRAELPVKKGVNVVHFAHDIEFTRLSMWARWEDDAGVAKNDRQVLDI